MQERNMQDYDFRITENGMLFTDDGWKTCKSELPKFKVTLYEKIKRMSIDEMAKFLDEIVLNGIECGKADNCDVCEVEECTLPSYKVKLTWDCE